MKKKRSAGGMQLCQQRRNLLITQTELGAAIGKTSAWVSLVELGKHQPSPGDVEKIECFLSYALDELVVQGRQS